MHGWSLDQDGFCFSCNIFVKVIPNLKDYEIMSMIHKLNDLDYIITDSDGELSALGRKIAEMMDLNPNKLNENRFNIQLFAPKLMKLYKDYFTDFDIHIEP